MGLKINVGEGKVLVVKKDQRTSCEKVWMSREEIEDVKKFKYLRVMISEIEVWG